MRMYRKYDVHKWSNENGRHFCLSLKIVKLDNQFLTDSLFFNKSTSEFDEKTLKSNSRI